MGISIYCGTVWLIIHHNFDNSSENILVLDEFDLFAQTYEILQGRMLRKLDDYGLVRLLVDDWLWLFDFHAICGLLRDVLRFAFWLSVVPPHYIL